MTDLTLVDFLRARLDEDAAYARNALGLLGVATEWHRVDVLRERGLTRADAQHVHRMAPARVLADVEAKRRIVHQALGIAEVARVVGQEDLGGEAILRLLALPYADHPDYNESWRP